MLAWDHSLFFALEREVLQKIVFDIATVDRFAFKTDGTVPLGGSHHQKVAIIDGQVAFMGSADICQDRWDTSAHVARDPRRVSRKDQAYKPYHEVQAVFTGEAARARSSISSPSAGSTRPATRLEPERFVAPESAEPLRELPGDARRCPSPTSASRARCPARRRSRARPRDPRSLRARHPPRASA